VQLWSFSRIPSTVVRIDMEPTLGCSCSSTVERSACRILVLSAEIVYEMGDDG
jgi:hypothetical protein